MYLGILCGNTAGPYLYSLFPYHGYEIVFGTGCALCACSLIYVILLVPESITSTEVNDTKV